MTMQQLCSSLEWLEMTEADRERFWHSMKLRCIDGMKPCHQQQIDELIRKLMEKGMTETEANQAAIEIANAMKPKAKKHNYSIGYLIEVLQYHGDYSLLTKVYRDTLKEMDIHDQIRVKDAKETAMEKLRNVSDAAATELLMVLGGLMQ